MKNIKVTTIMYTKDVQYLFSYKNIKEILITFNINHHDQVMY